MRILLTGACGLIGRAIRRIGAAQHEFVLFDISPSVENEGGIRASVSDFDAVVKAAEGCDAIIHTAAVHGALVGKASHAEFITTNVIGADNLCRAAMKVGIKRIVMSSTMEIYVGPDWTAYGMTVIDESLPPRPTTIYPLSKVMVEQLGEFYVRTAGLEIVQLRYVNVLDKSPWELDMRALSRDVTAADVARANLAATILPNLLRAEVNIGPDTPLTQQDMFDAQKDPWQVLERYWPGCKPFVERAGMKPKSANFWPIARIDAAKAILGYEPESRFEAVLAKLGWKR